MKPFKDAPEFVDETAKWRLRLMAASFGSRGLSGFATYRNGTGHEERFQLNFHTAKGAEQFQKFATARGIDAAKADQIFAKFAEIAESRLQPSAGKGSEHEHPYVVDKGRICARTFDRSGTEVMVPLLRRGNLWISEHTIIDDGATEEHRLVIGGELASGESLPSRELKLDDLFADPAKSLAKLYGPRIGVAAGKSEQARDAIQCLSNPVTRLVYGHIGWRKIDAAWLYLHFGGAIGALGAASGLDVDYRESLRPYVLALPRDQAELREAVRLSLSLREVAPLAVTAPLLGAIYLAPLQELLGEEVPDFALGLFGESGEKKSELAALAQGHFGKFTRKNLTTFSSTSNAIERAIYDAKDAPRVVDDYHPGNSRYEERELTMKIVRLLRSVGERAGRSRMNRDTTARRDLPPRALVIVTGERRPRGYSNLGRLFPIEMIPKSVSLTKLSLLQALRSLLPTATGGYVQWLAAYFEPLREWLPFRFRELRAEFARELHARGAHAREPGQLAHLQLGLETFARFAVDHGAIAEADAEAFLDDTRDTLLGLALEHAEEAPEEKPTARFRALLADGFASKAIYVEDREDGGSDFAGPATHWGWELSIRVDSNGEERGELRPRHNATLVGWIDAEWLYLLSEPTHQYLQQAARRTGELFPVGLATLLRRLEEEKLIRSTPGSGRRTVRIRRGDTLHWVIQLRRSLIAGDTSGEPPAGGNKIDAENLGNAGLFDACSPVPSVPPKKMRADCV